MDRKTIWVCSACGKRSNDKYGIDYIDKGWDVSCFLNSFLCYEDTLVIENCTIVSVEVCDVEF